MIACRFFIRLRADYEKLIKLVVFLTMITMTARCGLLLLLLVARSPCNVVSCSPDVCMNG